jgi:glutathione S-transferase
MSDSTIILHGLELSGHCHRVAMFLQMLGLNYRFAPVPPKTAQTPAFLKLSPLGQIPALQDGDLVLVDSNAILVYLAKRYSTDETWLPTEPVAAAQVQRWLSIAAGEVKYGPCTARMIALWNYPSDPDKAKEIAKKLLQFMDSHLAENKFLAAGHRTIADLACYSYIAHAPEGGISLEPYTHVRAWLRRVEALPHFKPMPASVAAA